MEELLNAIQKASAECAYDRVIELCCQGLEINPYMIEFTMQLANAYEKSGEFLNAYKYYTITGFLNQYHGEYQKTYIEEALERVVTAIEVHTGQLQGVEEQLEYQKRIREVLEGERNIYGYSERAFVTPEQIIGKYFRAGEEEIYYVGSYQDKIKRLGDMDNDVFHKKAEFQKVLEGTGLVLADEGRYIIPIAAEEKNTIHLFSNKKNGKEVSILQRYDKTFEYYMADGGTYIYSSGKSYYGKAVRIQNDTGKKRLVLNIFVDGLAQMLLRGEMFEKYMPCVYRYFKNGVICDRAYSTGEWTYPVLATYISGLSTTQHMMFHNQIDGSLPHNIKTLAEGFEEAGYYTSAVNGDWRIIPSYGHARGYDHFIFQNSGFDAAGVVTHVIDQIEAMKDINQFIWCSFGDLHDVADEWELPMDVSVKLNLQDMGSECTGPTSVKQNYSEHKKKKYIMVMQRIDRYLGVLFEYIKNNYQEEEVLVSLFSDHGQGYLVPPGGEFLATERTNIAYMFRGCGCEPQRSQEIMSNLDYVKMMYHFAGIPYQEDRSEAVLPKCFGGEGRKWAVTESLHPGDPYRAVFNGDHCYAYFYNPVPVGHDGRFALADYEFYLMDDKGERFEDESLKNECLAVVRKRIKYLIKK